MSNDLCRFAASATAVLRCTTLRLSVEQLMMWLSSGPEVVTVSPLDTGRELMFHLPNAKNVYLYTLAII